MRKISKIIYVAFSVALLSGAVVYPQGIKESVAREIKMAFAEEVTFEYEKLLIPRDIRREIEATAKQKFFKDYIYLYRIYNGDKKIAVAFLDNVYGKSMPITFLTIFDLEGNIISTSILKYREPYGGAVSNKNWTKQFEGKNSSSGFKVGEDINSISGATISVNSVTKGVYKLTLLFDKLKDSL